MSFQRKGPGPSGQRKSVAKTGSSQRPSSTAQVSKSAPGKSSAGESSSVKSSRPPGPPWTEAQWLAALPPLLIALDLSLEPQQQQQLAAYMVLLAHWNATFNLTALRDPQDMLSHHLADCLTVLKPLGRYLRDQSGRSDPESAERGDAPAVGDDAMGGKELAGVGAAHGGSPMRLLDVGSGGGLPGVVLAICFPDLQVTCVDTVGKKAAFIRQAGAELKLSNLRAEHARVEQLKGPYDIVTSRAFASLLDFVTLTHEALSDGAVWMAMKGKQPDEELADLPPNIDVFHVEQLHVPDLDAQRCLVWMRPA